MNMWPYGCDGYLSTFVTLCQQVSQNYWQAVQANDVPAAVKVIAQQDMPFVDYICKLPGGFNAGIAGMLELSGIASRYRRKPYYSLNNTEMAQLEAFLAQIGITFPKY